MEDFNIDSNNTEEEKYYTESYICDTKNKRRRILKTILISLLCLIIGASSATAGIGYFLSVNDVDVKGLITGDREVDVTKTPLEIENVDKDLVREVIKKIEITDEVNSPVAAIAKKVIPSIVGIEIKYPNTNYFFNTDVIARGEGSGIILSEEGYIVTNNHVIENALRETSNVLYENASINVYLKDQLDKPYEAKVIGRDKTTDLAVLKIEAKDLIAAEVGDSDSINIGDLAVAIGNPGGMKFMGSVTSGVISGLNREMFDAAQSSGRADEKLNLIQTDAAINPGNSGGALVNAKGQVIGINTLKYVGEEYEGLGFAIPINKAMEIIDILKKDGYVSRGNPNIGINISTEYNAELAKKYNLPEGCWVAKVGFMTPAFKAGMQVNDIITEINGVRIKTFEQLDSEKNKYLPGDEITIKVFRLKDFTDPESGEYLELVLILGESIN